MNRKIAAIAALVLAAGCSSAATNALPPGGGAAAGGLPLGTSLQVGAPHVLAPFRGPSNLASFAWGRRLVARMSYVAPYTRGAIAVDVLVRMRDPRGLVAYAESASTPGSPNYRHFLTPSQIADRFGASATDYQAVAKYFAGYGMRVGEWPQREVLAVTGTIRQFKRALGTDFGVYRYGLQTVVAPLGTPHFTRALPVSAIMHLQSYDPAHTYNIRGSYANFAGYSPQMLASGFDYSGAYAVGYNGAGINVGINGTGPISAADLRLYAKLFHASVARSVQIDASPQPASPSNGNTGTGATDPYPAGLTSPPPVTAPCQLPPFPTPPNYNACNPEDYEAQLDTQQVAGLAPGATELFYIAYNPMICVNSSGAFVQNNKNGTCPKGAFHYPLMGIQLADDSLQQTIGDNRADDISLSWGEGENQALASDYINAKQTGLGNIEFASLAAEGIAVFVSSGDTGASECFDPNTGAPLGIACVSYPASDPNVTGVGGVNVPIDDAGKVNGQITAWADNTTEGGDGSFQNNVGSGGGISAVFTAPSYQKSAIRGITMREVPDIALDADPKTGVAQVNYAAFSPQVFADGGTSAAAPEAAAEWSLVLQACKQSSACATASGATPYRLGNAAPLFYRIYSGQAYLPYKQVFYDVIYGENQAVPAPTPTPPVGQTPAPLPTPIGYSAGPGYDMVTGLGVPFAGHLIDAIVKGAGAP